MLDSWRPPVTGKMPRWTGFLARRTVLLGWAFAAEWWFPNVARAFLPVRGRPDINARPTERGNHCFRAGGQRGSNFRRRFRQCPLHLFLLGEAAQHQIRL